MNRRQILKSVASFTLTTTSLACSHDEPAQEKRFQPAHSHIHLPDFSRTRLHEKLDQLVATFEARGLQVADSLLPEVSEKEIKQQCGWFPGELPEEILALYGWRGGQAKEAWDEEYPFWFRDNTFCSLERAEQEYQSMMRSYGRHPHDHSMLKYSFPFAAFNGAFYVLPTKGHNLHSVLTKPVISVHEGIDIYFYSLELMVDTCIEWVRNEKYSREGLYPQELELEIWKKHNPGIFEL